MNGAECGLPTTDSTWDIDSMAEHCECDSLIGILMLCKCKYKQRYVFDIEMNGKQQNVSKRRPNMLRNIMCVFGE